MNISEPFLQRPVGTTLLTVAVALAGGIAFNFLPVSPLPQVDFPTISVGASLPGASPQTMASSVATPLERQFGRIAGITEMTSTSSLGATGITIQFDLGRNIDAAARDVQAAINAARSNLPANLPGNPTYRKVNPADSPILIIALTSRLHSRGEMYDAASTVLAQKIAQIEGIGQVFAGGSSLPAVRVEANPAALNKYGIGFPQLANVLAQANANLPKGEVSNAARSWTIEANDQIFHAVDYQPLIVAYRNGSPVRVRDVAEVVDQVEDLRNAGYMNAKPSPDLKPTALLILFRQPNANIIDTVDRVRAMLPQLKADLPSGIDLTVVMDRTETIRASVHDVEITLVISVFLVVGVVFLFLRSLRATLIPAVAVPVSLIGTFGVMYLLGYSLDNLSLMALTISTGFVVDDAIVVLENISRHIEKGLPPLQAARRGAREIGFTVLSMSVSLCAVFIPLLLMGGIVGRLFREFAVTLTVAIAVSLVLSLTTTPMMCAHLLRPHGQEKRGRFYRYTEKLFERIISYYDRALVVVLRHPAITLAILALTIALNVFLFIQVPKGFFPEQDTGRIMGSIQADQASSFQAMEPKLTQMIRIVMADPAVSTVTGYTGGSVLNTARVFITLKPLSERKIDADAVIARLRPKLAKVPGATLYMQAAQDLRIGGRVSNALYQYALQADSFDELFAWAPRVFEEMKKLPQLVDVNTDQQDKGRQTMVEYDRDTASRFGIPAKLIDQTLYNAFGQSQASVMYKNLNQYHVVLEAAPKYWQNPETLRDIWVTPTGGAPVPLSAIARYATTTAPLSVNHQGQFPVVTISFNLAPGVSLGQAVNAIEAMQRRILMPSAMRGIFAGTAQAYQQALGNEPLLIAAALVTVYIILGMLYESYIHPITILSTLPSAGVGAVLALMITHTDLSIIALIGVVLLIGIVKKNGIMIVDFALAAEREEGKPPREAIHEACLLRFRPIMMTTMAALLGALPLAVGGGTGAELRRPLGITIIGGLIVSQALTLFTTPVIYLTLDRLRLRGRRPDKNQAPPERLPEPVPLSSP